MSSATIDVRRHRTAFSKRKLSLPQWYVLSIPGQWPVPNDEVLRIAASQSACDPRGAVDEETCRKARDQLIERGLLRVIRKADIDEIRRRVTALKCGEPLYGVPRVGDVDFTPKGAELFRGISNELYGRYFFSEAVVQPARNGRTVYTLRKKRADEIAGEADGQCECDVVSVSRIGPWCIYWWKAFPSGWRIELNGPKHRR